MIQMKPKNMSPSGFTLIEMIVVIIIIAILAGVGVPQYMKAVERTRASEAVNFLGAIRKAEEMYFARFASYVEVDGSDTPTGLEVLDISTATANLRFFNMSTLYVESTNPPAAGTAVGGTTDTVPLNLRIDRNGTQFTGLSGFSGAGYSVVMSSSGVILQPAQLQ